MKRLLLIDGNAILHRAYHAYPPSFTDKEGNPTNAIYGFYAMLLKLLQDVHPDYLAIAFDRGAPTFRMTMYAGYHANRPRMSDDLSPQVPRLQASLEEIGIPLYGIEGYEADDLLGTLSRLAIRPADKRKKNKKGINSSQKAVDEVIIITGDRDLLQLVNPYVKILMPLIGITKTALFDEARVEEKYGITPSQVIDYKALVGDASDNYPGVTGIGPKGAAALLQKYGTFENIYQHVSELPEGLGMKLAVDAEQAALAKKLATIQCDAPVHLRLVDCEVEKFSTDKFAKIFDELGFESLKKRMLGEVKGEELKTKSKKNPTPKEKKDSEQLGLL